VLPLPTSLYQCGNLGHPFCVRPTSRWVSHGLPAKESPTHHFLVLCVFVGVGCWRARRIVRWWWTVEAGATSWASSTSRRTASGTTPHNTHSSTGIYSTCAQRVAPVLEDGVSLFSGIRRRTRCARRTSNKDYSFTCGPGAWHAPGVSQWLFMICLALTV
jgi:hypothetical protein